jgi:hypothetical protein
VARLAAGSLRDRVDENRLCVYALSVEKVYAVAASDPIGVAGCMIAETFTRLLPPGEATFGRH